MPDEVPLVPPSSSPRPPPDDLLGRDGPTESRDHPQDDTVTFGRDSPSPCPSLSADTVTLLLSLCLVPYLRHRRTLRAPRSRGPVHGVVGRPVGVLAYRSEGVLVGQRACGWAGGHAGRSCGWATRACVRACGWAGRLTDRWACGRRMIAAGR